MSPSCGLEDLIEPAVLRRGIGAMAGLAPRRERGDEGQAPGADVDLVDALPRDMLWMLVAHWLQAAGTESTRRSRLQDLAGFLRWLDRHRPGCGLQSVTEQDITAYADSLLDGWARAGVGRVGAPMAPASVHRRLSHLSSLYRHGLRYGVADANPADVQAVDRPHLEGSGGREIVPPDERGALLTAALSPAFTARCPLDALFVVVSFFTGAHVSEIIALRAGAFRIDGGCASVELRRAAGARVFALPDGASALAARLVAGQGETDLVFITADGRPWDRWRPITALRRVASAAGPTVQAPTTRMVRATFSWLLRSGGLPRDALSEAMGYTVATSGKRHDPRAPRTVALHMEPPIAPKSTGAPIPVAAPARVKDPEA